VLVIVVVIVVVVVVRSGDSKALRAALDKSLLVNMSFVLFITEDDVQRCVVDRHDQAQTQLDTRINETVSQLQRPNKVLQFLSSFRCVCCDAFVCLGLERKNSAGSKRTGTNFRAVNSFGFLGCAAPLA
jgi:C4-dicarboxylate-specific signal transduction histidine kinase